MSGICKMDKTNSKYDSEVKQSITSSSLKKVLNSHSSIYNALTNPDLDVSPQLNSDASGNYPPEINEQFSITSWQSIGNESFNDLSNSKEKVSSSILSSVSDEEDKEKESAVIVPYPTRDKVMVFETDEEDEDIDEDRTLRPNIQCFNLSENPNSFIMPKLTVSDNISNNAHCIFQISVLSSPNYGNHTDAYQLIKYLEKDFSSPLIKFNHFIVNPKLSLFDEKIIRESNLVFVINDGSSIFVNYLCRIFRVVDGIDSDSLDSLPKLTIINMLTVNYFVNLFDLLNNLRPYQIWKTSSLKQDNLLKNLKTLIEIEFSPMKEEYLNKTLTTRDKNLSLTISNNFMYSSLVPSKKPDYKSIERSFKSELHLSTNIDNIDPLQLSSSFSSLKVFNSIIKKLFAFNSGCASNGNSNSYNRLWLICSFTIGIGIGVGIANGAAAILNFYFYNNYLTSGLNSPHFFDSKQLADDTDFTSTQINNSMANFSNNLMDSLKKYANDLKELKCFEEISELPSNLRSASSTVIDYFKGGLEKLTSFFLYSNH
ncbi:DEHA2E18194p [Debaryomyces hansenii CBS767]|uniref:DEHA2E18194p n=1 Tax=Debaryomyces hansenii (strain ATCC 36239 / CBS 767 / BCRC 21394 / JCM 1990 / NBRC 0083 / IGC 2968) TaxID=284592 RepID=Q6BNX9_DEBHA|nr:DEHA2E18194p [Debaryomyces hansenii CBS767]CAG88355.2 DEHA2E18194p [Debaryomyces hansenii CBS767]|eukprot:XP_460091.2 DEHA2E18194p [Debaryomyces hansenii CBS767]